MRKLLLRCLWGNKADLSLSGGVVEAQESTEYTAGEAQDVLSSHILSNDVPALEESALLAFDAHKQVASK